jgi:hypothetical protein
MALRRDHARVALASIRLVNGALALLAPGVMLRRLGADPKTNGVAVYPLRMFGIRTVLLGLELLTGEPTRQQGTTGVVIHATDAASAITAGLRRQLPARVAVLAAGISVTNTALALAIARDGLNGGDGHAAPGRRHDTGAGRRGAAAGAAPLAR